MRPPRAPGNDRLRRAARARAGCSAARRVEPLAHLLAQLRRSARGDSHAGSAPASRRTSPDSHSSPRADERRLAIEQAGRRDAVERQRPRRAPERRAHERQGVAARQQAQAIERVVRGTVPRRCRIEHDASGDRGLRRGGAQDHPVAARGETGSRSRSWASPVAPGASSSAWSSATRASTQAVPTSTWTRALVRHARAARQRRAARRRAGSSRAGSRECSASRRARSRRARSRPGSRPRAAPPRRARPARSCTSTERTRTSPPPGASDEPVAGADRPRPQRAGHDGADALAA